MTILASWPPNSFQLVIFPVKIWANWSRVNLLTGFLGFTTTARPSSATFISYGFIPFCLAKAISLSLMFLELMVMSQVALIKLAMPFPEPPPVTATNSCGLFSIYFSAQAWAKLTIVSEPLICRELFFETADAGFKNILSITTQNNFLDIPLSL